MSSYLGDCSQCYIEKGHLRESLTLIPVVYPGVSGGVGLPVSLLSPLVPTDTFLAKFYVDILTQDVTNKVIASISWNVIPVFFRHFFKVYSFIDLELLSFRELS